MGFTLIDNKSLKFSYVLYMHSIGPELGVPFVSRTLPNTILVTYISDSGILRYIQGYLFLAIMIQERQPSKFLAKRSHAMLVPVTGRSGGGVPQFVFFITTPLPPQR
jgi:hypothetical protein